MTSFYKISATLLVLLLLASPGFATIHVIMVGPNNTLTFSPSSGLTVQVGDTVRWTWATGTHTTTSGTIPAGAATWDHQLSSAGSFDYKVTVAGTYNYFCQFHDNLGMTGSFTATAVTAMPEPLSSGLSAYPNPVRGNLTLAFDLKATTSVSLEALTTTGQVLELRKAETMPAGHQRLSVNVNDSYLTPGVYVLRLRAGEAAYTQRLIVQ